MTSVYLGLGTNLGDRKANLEAAIAAIGAFGRVLGRSRLYETAPVGVLDQPAFLNMALAVETDLDPHALLAELKSLEKRLGRVEGLRWGPRLIDLDILMYGDRVVTGEMLEIPHPRLTERRFALAPLADLAVELFHPVTGKSIADHLADLPADDDVVIVED